MWSRTLVQAGVYALTGQEAPAFAALDVAVGPDEKPSWQRAAAQCIGGTAAMRQGHLVLAAALADACIATAKDIDEPGWEANARCLRVLASPSGVSDDGVLENLVAAEFALKQTEDRDLISSARVFLGIAYQSHRLFELAVKHQYAGLEDPEGLFGLKTNWLLPLLHLGETHLHWADELGQLGEQRHDESVREHRWLAADLARAAVEAASGSGVHPAFLNEARMLQICASWEADPEQASSDLAAAMRRMPPAGIRNWDLQRRIRLVEIHAGAGRPDLANQRARDALADPSTARDRITDARSRFVAVTRAAESGVDGAQLGLECAQMVARSSWAQRTTLLQSIERVLAVDEDARQCRRYLRGAQEDPLTGVGNRRVLDDWLAALGSSPRPSAVVVVDVDDFKAINDTYGHVCGDDALRTIAQLISGHTRECDRVARFGGDEFVVILESADEKQARTLVDRWRLAILDLATTTAHDHLRGLSVSIGCASTSEAIPVDALLEIADARMYADKGQRTALITGGGPIPTAA